MLRTTLVEVLGSPSLLLPHQPSPNVSTIDDYLGLLVVHLASLEPHHEFRRAVDLAIQAASLKMQATLE